MTTTATAPTEALVVVSPPEDDDCAGMMQLGESRAAAGSDEQSHSNLNRKEQKLVRLRRIIKNNFKLTK